jgi:hypothetical protein
MVDVSGIFGVLNVQGIAESLSRMGAAMTGVSPSPNTGDPALERAGFGTRSNQAFLGRKVPFVGQNWVAVFDGVLFGRFDVAQEIKSYAELVLGMFLERGEDFALDLRGNFAIALYNRREHQLWLYSDHFSSKPLYFYSRGGRFYFASELKALLAEGNIPARVHVGALREAFGMGYVCGTKTLIRDIERLPAGRSLHFDGERGRVKAHVYFPITNQPLETDESDMEEKLERAMRIAVHRSLGVGNADDCVPLFTLSGGLDSRAVCAIARDRGLSPLVTLNIAEMGSVEQHLAARVAEKLESDHHFLPYDGGDWLVDHLDRAVEAGDGMHHFIDSARMLYALPTLEGEEFCILQTGMSGDFIFGSFLRANDLETSEQPVSREVLADLITRRLCMGMWRGLESLQDEAGNRQAFVAAVREDIFGTIPEAIPSLGRLRGLEMWNLHNRQIRGIFGYYRGAETYMEYHSPFFDPDVFQLAFRLPAADRFHERLYLKVLSERVLQRALAVIPWSKTGLPIVGVSRSRRIYQRVVGNLRKRFLQPISRETWRRSSGNPYLYWVWKNQQLRDAVRDQLVEFDRPEIFYLEREGLKRFLDDWRRRPLRSRDCLLHLFYLVAVVRWLENHKHQIEI